MPLFRFLLLLVLSAFVFEAGAKDVSLHGVVLSLDPDSLLRPLSDANAIVFRRADSLFVKAVLTDESGRYDLAFTPKKGDGYVLRVSMTGYYPESVDLDSVSSHISNDTIVLRRATMLDDLEVLADVPDIVRRGDTTVINAASFKVPDGSMLEELVKRIPGLEYDQRNHTMTYNGRAVSEINVNGEVFFAGNNKLALTNLPVEVIEKIKIYNKQSEESKYTGIKGETDNYVLDLNTKKGFDGVITAEASLSAGTERRKGGDLMANTFKTDGDAISLNFTSGNLNHNSLDRRNRSDDLGFNFNKKIGSGLRINASFYGNINKGGDVGADYSEQYLPTGNRYQNSLSGSYFDSRSLSGHFNMRWELDDKTYLSVGASYNSSKSHNEGSSRTEVFSEKQGLDLLNPFENPDAVNRADRVNGSENNSQSRSRNSSYNVALRGVRRLGHKGASITLMLGTGGGNSESNSHTVSRTDFYRLTSSSGSDSVLARNQYRQSPGENRSLQAGARFTYPVTEDVRVSAAYTLRSSRGSSTRSTYGLPSAIASDRPELTLPDNYLDFMVDSLSDDKRSRLTDHDFSLYAEYSRDPLLLSLSFTAQHRRSSLDQQTGYNAVDTLISRLLLHPVFHAEWNKSDIRIDFNYEGNTGAPSISDLISVTDNSNPLYVSRANPNLRTSYRHDFRLGFNHIKSGVSAYCSFSNEWNTIVRAVSYDAETGGRITEPRNVNGNYSSSFMARYYRRMGNFSVSAVGSASMSNSVSLVNEGISPEPQKSVTSMTSLNVGADINYMPAWGGFFVRGRFSSNYSDNSLNDTKNRTDQICFGLSAFANLPFGLKIDTSLDCSFRGGTYVYSGQKRNVMWHAGLMRTFFKKNQLEVALRWHDILNQKISTSVNSSSTSFSESYSDQIGGYVLLSVKYRFSTNPLSD